MKNSFGNSIILTLFGESHGEYIGAVLDGLAPGIKVDVEFIKHQLTLRRPNGAISTSRVEQDEFEIVSGVFNGFTTGTPLTIIIKNNNISSKDYQKNYGIATPSGANLTGYYKYHGYEDYRGNGHFSGRVTAAIVAICAIITSALNQKGIKIGTHIKQCKNVKDDSFSDNIFFDIDVLNTKEFACLSTKKQEEMIQEILKAKENNDSVSGILETAIVGMAKGVGEPFFSSLESELSAAIFSIPAVKGVEFGLGFDYVNYYGSEVNDKPYLDDKDIKMRTNNNGGISGGISNGMPIIFSTVIKPTPSISQQQQTVNFIENKECVLQLNGRHDPAIFHRARVVIDSLAALVVADQLALRFGTDYLKGE